MSTPLKLGTIALLALVGCGGARPSAETRAAESVDPMFACAVDSDCVAIEDDGSCPGGVLVAVNGSYADRYCAAEAPAPDCTIAAAADVRVANCDFAAHRCQLIAPTEIHCGGFIHPNHGCPAGYACDFHGRVPDVGGSCVARTN